MNKELINKYANDILIDLTDEEAEKTIEELNVLDKHMTAIEKLNNIKDVEPLTHPFDLYTATLRDDIAEDGEMIENVLRNSDVVEAREIEVPKVVG